MASPLKWIFELYDKITPPARAMEQSILAVDKAANRAGGSIDKLGAGGGMGGFATKFALVSEAVRMGSEAVVHLVEKVAELGTEFVKSAMDAATFEQANRNSLKALLGASSQVDEVIASQRRFALGTGLSLELVAKQYRDLLQGGFKQSEIPVILRAAGDISQIRGEGAAGVAAYAQAFADIRSRGQLTGRGLGAFKGVIDFDELAKNLGIAKGGYHELVKVLNEQPVGAARGINALLDALAKKDGGLGVVLEKQAHSIPGIIERISSGWKIMLGDLSEKPEFGAFQKAFERVAEMFDPATEAGKRMEQQVGAVLERVLGLLTKLSDPEVISTFFDAAVGAAKKFVSVLDEVLELMDMVTHKSDAEGEKWQEFKTFATEGPAGIMRAHKTAFAAKGLSKTLEEHNAEAFPELAPLPALPSVRKFAAGGEVSSPTLALLGEGGKTERVTSKGSSSSDFNLEQNFHISTDKDVNERELAEHLSRIAKSDLYTALEQFAQSQGAI